MIFDIGKDLQNAFNDGYKARDSEIVRCKDCKHRYDEGKCPMAFGYYVDYDDDGFWESEWRTEDNTEDDGFCHKGERECDDTD